MYMDYMHNIHKYVRYELYARYELYGIYDLYAICRQYMLNIKIYHKFSDMQYMQYGCIYKHMAIQHIWMKYLGPF